MIAFTLALALVISHVSMKSYAQVTEHWIILLQPFYQISE
jgi:hypothetical protein